MKVYVAVELTIDEAGIMHPQRIVWEDGRKFEIAAVLDVRRAASLKAGGSGMRYTCRVGEKQLYLFHDDVYWFIEAE